MCAFTLLYACTIAGTQNNKQPQQRSLFGSAAHTVTAGACASASQYLTSAQSTLPRAQAQLLRKARGVLAKLQPAAAVVPSTAGRALILRVRDHTPACCTCSACLPFFIHTVTRVRQMPANGPQFRF
jgi:hypothetical protein